SNIYNLSLHDALPISFNEYEDYSREEVSYVSKQRPQRRGLFDKIKNKFNVNDAEETTEQWQPRYQPSIKVDKEPSWEVYDDTDALASTAASERARLERDKDLVLDLDYFDQISNHTKEDESESVVDMPQQPNYDYNNPSDWDAPMTYEEKSYNNEEIDADDDILSHEIADILPADPTNQDTVQHSNAAHWQQQSDNIQNTTDNDLASVLEQSRKANPTQKKESKKSKHKGYKLPSKNLLTKNPPVDQSEEYKRINENIDKLARTFKSCGGDGKIVKENVVPSLMKFEIEPAIGVKVSKIVSLSDDIALSLAVRDIRIEAPIPGK